MFFRIFGYICKMKNTLLQSLLIVILTMTGCNRHEPIDKTFQWPSSGVEEADSLILEWERLRSSVNGSLEEQKRVSDQLCSLASRHADNKILEMRKDYVSVCTATSEEVESDAIQKLMERPHANGSDYDWHMLKSIWCDVSKNGLYDRYMEASDNLSYFNSINDIVGEARTLNSMGNIFFEASDRRRAYECYRSAEKLFDSVGLTHQLNVVKINMSNVAVDSAKDRALIELLNNKEIKKDEICYATVLQNAFIRFDSLPLIDKAIEILEKDPFSTNLPMCLALKGKYMIIHGDTESGMKLIESAFDLIRGRHYPVRFTTQMHRILSEAYFTTGQKDSCILTLARTIWWIDSLERSNDVQNIHALDMKVRIDMAEKNSKLEKSRMSLYWIVSLLVLSLIIVLLLYSRRNRRIRMLYERRLMREKMENERQSLRAQARIMEENDNLIAQFSDVVGELEKDKRLNTSDLTELRNVVKVYQGNKESRKAYLKTNMELDSTFYMRLKEDFPSLAEGSCALRHS